MKFVNFQDFQYLKLDPVLPEFEEKVAKLETNPKYLDQTKFENTKDLHQSSINR